MTGEDNSKRPNFAMERILRLARWEREREREREKERKRDVSFN